MHLKSMTIFLKIFQLFLFQNKAGLSQPSPQLLRSIILQYMEKHFKQTIYYFIQRYSSKMKVQECFHFIPISIAIPTCSAIVLQIFIIIIVFLNLSYKIQFQCPLKLLDQKDQNDFLRSIKSIYKNLFRLNIVLINNYCLLLQIVQKMTTQIIPIQKKLQETHPGYAYELLELQMAVQDDKMVATPSISEITKLIQLYMVGVEVLQSIGDPRFIYFNNKIHNLMMKKHIVKKLHQSTGKNPKDLSMTAINRAELKEKKNQYQINNYFNQGLVDIKKVKQMLNNAEKRESQFQGKIKTDIKKQQERLDQRIKQRKMRSEHGSVKKSKISQEKNSPNHNKDIRMQYFDSNYANYATVASSKGNRISGSVEKIIERKNGRVGGKFGSAIRPDPKDAI